MNKILKNEKIIKEWTDYNGHLNVAYYVHVFDIAADVMLDHFNMGGLSAKKIKKLLLWPKCIQFIIKKLD
tara:strand:+ start:404 stop:613 length:210 start_codon:yes stop_codon:yes gene_type:complete